jgi:molecular chaperone GrpE
VAATGQASAKDDGAKGGGAKDDGAKDDGGLGELRAQLAERTSDLQRVTAEYANYRRRVERDREVVVATAKATVVTELLAVLDDIERAQAHGDLTGAFKAVADKLTATLTKAGLKPFGSEGDGFDPAVHQAVQHNTSPDVDGPTVSAVLRRGYQLGERLLRTAMVAVTDHEPATEPAVGPADGPAAEQSEEPAEATVDDQPLLAGPAVDHRPAQAQRQDPS